MSGGGGTRDSSHRRRQHRPQQQQQHNQPQPSARKASSSPSTMTMVPRGAVQQPKKPRHSGAGVSFSSSSSSSSSSSLLFILLQMAVCVGGIYLCFGLWSIKQERVITKPYYARDAAAAGGAVVVSERKLSSVFVIGFAQALAGILVGSLLLFGEGRLARRAGNSAASPKSTVATAAVARRARAGTVRMVALMGFTNAFGSSLGYAAMRRLPYPVVLATKMSKMVPVMLVGFLWHGTRYSLAKCLACAVITGGIACFYLLDEAHGAAKPSAAAAPGWIGFVLLAVNLVADGFTNSTQDVLVKTRGWGGNRLMVFTNLSSCLWLAAVLLLLEAAHPLATAFLAAEEAAAVASADSSHPAFLLAQLDGTARWLLREAVPLQDLSHTLKFFAQHPDAVQDVLSMSVLNAMGQFFVFRTISLFGTLTLTALTLLRKAGSVLLSILYHGHHVAAGQWVSLLIVFLGVLCEAFMHVRGGAGKGPRVPNRTAATAVNGHNGHKRRGKEGTNGFAASRLTAMPLQMQSPAS